MLNTQARPGTKNHDQEFRSSARSPLGPREKQHWPVRAGDRLHGSLKKRKSPSSGSNEQPSTFDYDYAVRQPTAMQQFFASFSLERSFTLLGFIVAVLAILVFGSDLACGWPFRRASLLFDATSTVCGAVLLLLCWDVFREQVKGLIR